MVARKKLPSALQTVREDLQTLHEGSRIYRKGSFACNIATHFKLISMELEKNCSKKSLGNWVLMNSFTNWLLKDLLREQFI